MISDDKVMKEMERKRGEKRQVMKADRQGFSLERRQPIVLLTQHSLTYQGVWAPMLVFEFQMVFP